MLLLLPSLPSGLGLGLLCLSRAAALGFNQSLWVYAAELLPTAVRASGTAALLEALRAECHKPNSWRSRGCVAAPMHAGGAACSSVEERPQQRGSWLRRLQANTRTPTLFNPQPHPPFSSLPRLTNRHRGRHVLRAPRRHRGCQHAHRSLARLARRHLGHMQCGLPAGRRARTPRSAARHRGRVPARHCR